MGKSILIADDEPDLLILLKQYFELNNYMVFTAACGSAVFDQISRKPDLILLDINLPDIDGLTVCQRIRQYFSGPILFLTARITQADQIHGFAMGGDDYILKPFNIQELGARVAAHLRRDERTLTEHNICFDGNLIIDYGARKVLYQNKALPFPKKEFEIIELLCRNAGQTLTKEQIYERLWGYDSSGSSTVIPEHIRRIRKKFQDCGSKAYIQTVWGVGYRWEK